MRQHKNDIWRVDFRVDLGGLVLKNPLIAASGTFGYGDELLEVRDPARFGAICVKSITAEPREGNEPPRIAEVERGLLNSIGLANIGVDAFITYKLPFLKELNTKVIANIAGFSIEDYLRVVRKLDDVEGIDAYELNISCPNVEGGLEFGSSADSAAELTRIIRRETERFLIVKLSPNVTDIQAIAVNIESEGSNALSLINTLVGMKIDIETFKPALRRIYGGYSGPAVKPVALAMVHKVATSVSIPVIGLGGIFTPEDAAEFLIAGASAVQLGTVNFVNPDAAAELENGLRDIAESKGIREIAQLTGSIQDWE